MIPRTLSASSLQVYELCPDRWNAEYMQRGSQEGNSAAATGSAFHGGAEMWVEAVYIKREFDHILDDKVKLKELLINYYRMSYIQVFNSADLETPEYKDGLNLTMKWFQRTSFENRKVVSVEQKKTIPIPFNHPDGPTHRCENCLEQPDGVCVVPFNYIMDRLDQTGEGEYEVVDYKTVRVPIQPEDLEAKVQARAYALAVQIEHPEATRIKVTFDLIRHERISIWVTREENISFWHYLCATLQRIVDATEDDMKPIINSECGYCVKKATCPVLQSNVSVGGIHSIQPDDLVGLLQQVQDRKKALANLEAELKDQVLRHAASQKMLEWETGDGAFEVEVKGGRGRAYDSMAAAKIMGPELFAQMGNMTLGNLDKIIADESLPQEMRDQLKALIHWEQGNLQVKIKRKKTL